MRISLLQISLLWISLLRFFKTFQKYLANVFFWANHFITAISILGLCVFWAIYFITAKNAPKIAVMK